MHVIDRSYRESERRNPEQSVKAKTFDVDIVNPATRSFEWDGTARDKKAPVGTSTEARSHPLVRAVDLYLKR
jgi:hypothetical protein